MATRIYRETTDFDAQQGHFTIEVVDSQYYLRIGALNSEDQRLIGSLIDDGFVGFFQDEVRIAIAGITSTYDAENDRIEIDRELPELQIEDEYVIRFTQARPGEDGIAPPSEDGEHAEIEIEDTKTGIRVRGKSGGEPAFGPWHDVRDGIDGEEGEDGWSPKFATVSDGERRVLQVADWFGGSGTKPDIGQYIGAAGFVTTIGEGVDIRGPAGEDGKDGEDGAGCLKSVVFSDHDGSENQNRITLPENYEDFDEVYVALYRNYTRTGKYSIATLKTATNPRVQGVTFSFNTKTRVLSINGTGNFREVTLIGCESDPAEDLVFTTRGELIATTSFLPQSITDGGNLANDYTWTVNTTDFLDPYPFGDTRGVEGFIAHATQGRLATPYKKPLPNVNGLWAVTENLALAGEDKEVYEVFIPWNMGSSRRDGAYHSATFYLHLAIAEGQPSNNGDDIRLVYSKRLNNNVKPEMILWGTGVPRTLPSTQCRVKIYLAGVFLTTETE